MTTIEDYGPEDSYEVRAGGPAFPQAIPPCSDVPRGMTLLDYFAAHAMIAAVHARLPDDNVGVYSYKVAAALIAEKKRLEA